MDKPGASADIGAPSSSSYNSRLLAAILGSNIILTFLLLAILLFLVATWRKRRQLPPTKTLPPTDMPANPSIPPYAPIISFPHGHSPAHMPVHASTPPAKADLAAPPGPHTPVPQRQGSAPGTPQEIPPGQYYWQTLNVGGAAPPEYTPQEGNSGPAPQALFRVVLAQNPPSPRAESNQSAPLAATAVVPAAAPAVAPTTSGSASSST